MTEMRVESPAFTEYGAVPREHSQDGENVSPELRWSGVPEGATELVLMCEDPDAPDGTFLHWLVTGVDPASTGVDEGAVPDGGREWTNTAGEKGYSGPKPPMGADAHRYFFRVYALGEPIALPEQPTAQDVHNHVDQVALAEGFTVGLFQR